MITEIIAEQISDEDKQSTIIDQLEVVQQNEEILPSFAKQDSDLIEEDIESELTTGTGKMRRQISTNLDM